LQVLSKLARREELELTTAHFDHGLRSDDERTEEREAATRLAGSLAVPLVTGSADVRSEARRTRRSLEDAARRGRYDFLARTALTAGCKIVATGHTASDQAETVIMHILRGTGLKGLAGMAPRSSWPFSTDPVTGDLALIRPLLLLGRDETADYCAASGINPIEDASNESRAFLRNRVRHDLLPALREFNPGVDKALVRLAGAVRYDLEYIESVAATALHAEAAGMRLDLTVLAGWPASLRYHALRLALSSLEDDNPAVSEQHILALDRLAVNGRTGDSLNLPMDYIAKRERRAIFLKLKDESPPVGEVLTEASRLKVPGEARAGRFLFSASTN
jgi:tRNA(Ile)-lysidine synthase